MEYVFGTKGQMEVLKTKGDSHTDLTGFHQIERTYPDQTITDSFRVVRKLGSEEDGAGSCYDWYEIDRHYRTVDKTGPLVEQVAQNAEAAENALCDLDAATEERLSAVEEALCELDSIVNGGEN
ncbi:MAG: hypothetical protein NC311_08195 [Muribaculaceae bacterium]|nr:hypothetical protein [Muribaculaceae bacterium]MCM1439320.1 hypothetical protein [Roseburia sp.]